MGITIDNYLRLNVTDMIMVLISTFLIVLIAYKFFWSKVLDYLKRREDAIAGDLKAAADEKAAQEAMRVEYETQLAGAKGEALEIIEKAKVHAKDEKQTALKQAKAEADKIKEKALQDIEREKLQAKEEIKDQITEVAFLAAEKIVGKELDEAKHKDYVKDFIDNAGEASWTSE